MHDQHSLTQLDRILSITIGSSSITTQGWVKAGGIEGRSLVLWVGRRAYQPRGAVLFASVPFFSRHFGKTWKRAGIQRILAFSENTPFLFQRQRTFFFSSDITPFLFSDSTPTVGCLNQAPVPQQWNEPDSPEDPPTLLSIRTGVSGSAQVCCQVSLC